MCFWTIVRCIPLTWSSSLTDDVVWLLVSFCDFRTMIAWRSTCRRNFAIVASVLRARYKDLVRSFVPNVFAFNDALRRHSAVISGSVALYYFIPCATWFPNDMDIYVSHDEFPTLLYTLENDPALQFRPVPLVEDLKLPTSFSVDVAEIRKFTTPSGLFVDVIRSRRSTPVSPLAQFWTSMLVNFLTPDACVSAFPRMVFNGRGYVKDFGMTSRDVAAMRKYAARDFCPGAKFEFIPEHWATWKDPFYWQKDYFSDGEALVIDFRSRVQDSMPSLPIHSSMNGWKMIIPFPAGALSYLRICVVDQLTSSVLRTNRPCRCR